MVEVRLPRELLQENLILIRIPSVIAVTKRATECWAGSSLTEACISGLLRQESAPESLPGKQESTKEVRLPSTEQTVISKSDLCMERSYFELLSL